MKLRDFIPPALQGTLRHRSDAVRQYHSFSEALAESDTYEAADIIELVLRKTEIYRDQLAAGNVGTITNYQTLQSLFVLSYVRPDQPLNILEVGGACGASYFEMAHLLPHRIASWRIVETPAMAARARKAFQLPALSFFDNLAEAIESMKSRDLLIAQGVLQYMAQPLDKFDELLALSFGYVYVSRTVTFANNSDDQASIVFNARSNLSEHGPGPMPAGFTDRPIRTTCTLVGDESFNGRIPDNYQQRFRFTEGKSQPMIVGSRKLQTNSTGFLLRKNPETPDFD